MAILSPKNDRFQLSALDLVEALHIYKIKKIIHMNFEILAWYQGGAGSRRISQNYRIYLLIIIYCRTYLAIAAGQFLISSIGFLSKVLGIVPTKELHKLHNKLSTFEHTNLVLVLNIYIHLFY
jgi:hypothetical protein